jgi:hypothetical protein
MQPWLIPIVAKNSLLELECAGLTLKEAIAPVWASIGFATRHSVPNVIQLERNVLPIPKHKERPAGV